VVDDALSIEEGDMVFVASEVVITPLMSMLCAMRDRGDCKHVLLINGNRPDVGHDVPPNFAPMGVKSEMDGSRRDSESIVSLSYGGALAMVGPGRLSCSMRARKKNNDPQEG
jgi:hypothetical protein